MPSLDIEGVLVEFPYDPYDVQVKYMAHVIRSLQGGANALLESPTGTGKARGLRRARTTATCAA